MAEKGVKENSEDVSKRTILVLLILTILISTAGVITLLKATEQKSLQMAQEQTFQNTGSAKVVVTIRNPNLNQTAFSTTE